MYEKSKPSDLHNILVEHKQVRIINQFLRQCHHCHQSVAHHRHSHLLTDGSAWVISKGRFWRVMVQEGAYDQTCSLYRPTSSSICVSYLLDVKNPILPYSREDVNLKGEKTHLKKFIILSSWSSSMH